MTLSVRRLPQMASGSAPFIGEVEVVPPSEEAVRWARVKGHEQAARTLLVLSEEARTILKKPLRHRDEALQALEDAAKAVGHQEAQKHLDAANALRWEAVAQERRVIWRMSKRFTPLQRGDLTRDDLYGAGLYGAYRAARRYDPDRGIPFGMYARFWMRAEMAAACQYTAFTVRLPVSLRRSLIRIREAQRQGAKTEEELQEATALNPLQQRRILTAAQAVRYLDERTGEGTTIGEEIVDGQADAETCVFTHDLISQMRQVLETAELDDLSREILLRRYGLDGREPQTLDAVVKALDLPHREAVRRLEKQALTQLRGLLVRQGVRPPNS